MSPCKCGCVTFAKKTPVKGMWIEYAWIAKNGETKYEGTTDDLRDRDNKQRPWRCDKCGKKQPMESE